MLEINKAGYEIILQVHDEVVVEVDLDKAQQAKKEIREIMKTPQLWCDAPLDSETVIMDMYTK